MDKDFLRLVILGMGGVLIVGILLWGILANRKSRSPMDFYDRRNPLDNIDEALIVKTGEDDFDIVHLGSAIDEDDDELELNDDSELYFDDTDQSLESETPKATTSGIIQFSIVAKTEQGFSGQELLAALRSEGLQYTDFQIFQRLDINGLPEYAVASMVEPGTFPENEMEDFSCPGIVFFMQPDELDNSLEVYDQMIASISQLTAKMDGIEWDSERQPLTTDTVQAIRNTLS